MFLLRIVCAHDKCQHGETLVAENEDNTEFFNLYVQKKMEELLQKQMEMQPQNVTIIIEKFSAQKYQFQSRIKKLLDSKMCALCYDSVKSCNLSKCPKVNKGMMSSRLLNVVGDEFGNLNCLYCISNYLFHIFVTKEKLDLLYPSNPAYVDLFNHCFQKCVISLESVPHSYVIKKFRENVESMTEVNDISEHEALEYIRNDLSLWTKTENDIIVPTQGTKGSICCVDVTESFQQKIQKLEHTNQKLQKEVKFLQNECHLAEIPDATVLEKASDIFRKDIFNWLGFLDNRCRDFLEYVHDEVFELKLSKFLFEMLQDNRVDKNLLQNHICTCVHVVLHAFKPRTFFFFQRMMTRNVCSKSQSDIIFSLTRKGLACSSRDYRNCLKNVLEKVNYAEQNLNSEFPFIVLTDNVMKMPNNNLSLFSTGNRPDGQGTIIAQATNKLKKFEFETENKLRRAIRLKNKYISEKLPIPSRLEDIILEYQKCLKTSLSNLKIDSQCPNDFEAIRTLPSHLQWEAIIFGLEESQTCIYENFKREQIKVTKILLEMFESLAHPNPPGFKKCYEKEYPTPDIGQAYLAGAKLLFSEPGAATNSRQFLENTLGPHILEVIGKEIGVPVNLTCDQGGFNFLLMYALGEHVGSEVLNVKMGIQHTLVRLMNVIREIHGKVWLNETLIKAGIGATRSEAVISGKGQWAEAVLVQVDAAVMVLGNFFLDFCKEIGLPAFDIDKVLREKKGWPSEIQDIIDQSLKYPSKLIKFIKNQEDRLRKMCGDFVLSDFCTMILLHISQRTARPDLEMLALRKTLLLLAGSPRAPKYTQSLSAYFLHLCLQWHPKVLNEFLAKCTTLRVNNSILAGDQGNEVFNKNLKGSSSTATQKCMSQANDLVPYNQAMKKEEQQFMPKKYQYDGRVLLHAKYTRGGLQFLRKKSYIFSEKLQNELDCDRFVYLRSAFDKDCTGDQNTTYNNMSFEERGTSYVTVLFENLQNLNPLSILELTFKKRKIPLFGEFSKPLSTLSIKGEEILWEQRKSQQQIVQQRKLEITQKIPDFSQNYLKEVFGESSKIFVGPLPIQRIDGSPRDKKENLFTQYLYLVEDDMKNICVNPGFGLNFYTPELLDLWGLKNQSNLKIKPVEKFLNKEDCFCGATTLDNVDLQYIFDNVFARNAVKKSSMSLKLLFLHMIQKFFVQKFDQGTDRVIITMNSFSELKKYALDAVEFGNDNEMPAIKIIQMSSMVKHLGLVPPKLDSQVMSFFFEYFVKVRHSIFEISETEAVFVGLEIPSHPKGTIFVVRKEGYYVLQQKSEKTWSFLNCMNILNFSKAGESFLEGYDPSVFGTFAIFYSVKVPNLIYIDENQTFINVNVLVEKLYEKCSQEICQDILMSKLEFIYLATCVDLFSGCLVIPHFHLKAYWGSRLPNIFRIVCKLSTNIVKHNETTGFICHENVLKIISVYMSEEFIANYRKRNVVNCIEEFLSKLDVEPESLYDRCVQNQNTAHFFEKV